MNTDIVIAKTTFPSRKEAEHCVKNIIEKSLAACGQIGSEITSNYVWQAKTFSETEYPVEFKTSIRCEDLLKAEVLRLHTYECPEWITWRAKASQGYFEWVEQNCKS